MKDVGGAGFVGSLPSFLGRERAAVNVFVGIPRKKKQLLESKLLTPLLEGLPSDWKTQ